MHFIAAYGCKPGMCVGWHLTADRAKITTGSERTPGCAAPPDGVGRAVCLTHRQGIFHLFNPTSHSALFTIIYWKMKSLCNWVYSHSMTNTHWFVPSNYEQFYHCANSAGYWLKAIELIPKQTVFVVPSHYWSAVQEVVFSLLVLRSSILFV